MSIPSVTETPTRAPAVVPPAASGPGSGKDAKKEAAVHAMAPISPPPAAPPPPPPPPPVSGFDDEVLVGYHEATNRKVYDFVDPDSGNVVVQIPAEAVLNLVANILQKLEAEGLR